MFRITTLLLLLAANQPAFAQPLALFEKQLFIQGEDTLPCRILTPRNYSVQKKYPLLVFLHGRGERGRDNEKQLTWGAQLFLDSLNRARFPAIVVFPQCHEDDDWVGVNLTNQKDSLGGIHPDTSIVLSRSLALVMQFIDTLTAYAGVDKKRIYIGGLSMGGFGTFDILQRKPGLFAAAFPICGGGIPERATLYAKKTPLWIFHGDQDEVVPVAHSRRMVRALRSAGAHVKYSEYPGVGHDSWKQAFAEPELLPWLFAQRLK